MLLTSTKLMRVSVGPKAEAKSVQKLGGKVHWAADADEARRIVVEIAKAGKCKLAVKSKSMTSEEIHLNPALEQAGVEVAETDFGEYIIQLANERPSHLVAPAVHPRYRPLPTTPAAEFDIALLVPDGVSAASVEQVLRRASGELLERVQLFDEFRGAGVPEGARSLGWRLTFRHPDRTLRDKEVEGRRAKLLSTLESELGVRPRV